jgi:hypothetical protein
LMTPLGLRGPTTAGTIIVAFTLISTIALAVTSRRGSPIHTE